MNNGYVNGDNDDGDMPKRSTAKPKTNSVGGWAMVAIIMTMITSMPVMTLRVVMVMAVVVVGMERDCGWHNEDGDGHGVDDGIAESRS